MADVEALDLDWFWHRLADMSHAGALVGGSEGSVDPIWPRDRQVGVVVGDVGVGARLCSGGHSTHCVLLHYLFLLQQAAIVSSFVT